MRSSAAAPFAARPGPPPYGAAAGGSWLGGLLAPPPKRRAFSTREFATLIIAPALVCVVIYALFANVYQKGWEPVAAVIVALMAGAALLGLSDIGTRYQKYLSGFLWVAICSSAAMGLVSYQSAFARYWFLHETNSYTNVLPSESAAGFADAGKVIFADGVRVDTERAVGYKDRTVFCVAPIVDLAHTGLVQFWAAGRNCCSARGTFWCGDAWNPKARSGVVIRDVPPQYRDAIELAEAAVGVASAEHALLVDWVVDPERVEINFYRVGVAIQLASLLVQLLLFGLGAAALSMVLQRSPNFFR